MILRPYRSVLYIPGGRERALDKARSMAVDSIIFDLEDAVVGDEKAAARATLVQQQSFAIFFADHDTRQLDITTFFFPVPHRNNATSIINAHHANCSSKL